MTEKEKIKLIFAFKVKYLRQQQGLSYQQLREATGMSTSYLHDIEKGTKYPKIDKITALAKALGVDYDELVSTSASRKIQPIINLLQSDFLKLFPVELFGLDIYTLFSMFTNTPDRVNAFISTIIKITRNYQMRNEHFYEAALRSYQELFDNYFEEIEQSVKAFRQAHAIQETVPYTNAYLTQLLKDGYGIEVEYDTLPQKVDLTAIRSFYSEKEQILYLNKGLSSAQINFLLARELGFQFMEVTERPYATRIVSQDSFEKLFNNFKASYFSVALLMDEDELAEDIRTFGKRPNWEADSLLHLLDKYDVTPEMLLQRMTNIFPKHLGIKDLFFLRLYGKSEVEEYHMTKELHLSQLHTPHSNVRNEHYCRRWIAIQAMRDLRQQDQTQPIAAAQISQYWKTTNQYLCLTIAKPAHQAGGVSVTVGLLLTPAVRQQFRFLSDPNLKAEAVNTTCERCSIFDCEVRAMPPVVLQEADAQQKVLDALAGLG